MDLALSAEQQALRENIVDFARKELSGGAAERDRAQHFPRDLWDKCGAMGLTGLPVPEEHGGAGLPPLFCAVALEAFGYGCADGGLRSEEHTSELQSLMRISYAVFCLKKKN